MFFFSITHMQKMCYFPKKTHICIQYLEIENYLTGESKTANRLTANIIKH